MSDQESIHGCGVLYERMPSKEEIAQRFAGVPIRSSNPFVLGWAELRLLVKRFKWCVSHREFDIRYVVRGFYK
jgi:hypothetical protein